jgi:hypothetical protein
VIPRGDLPDCRGSFPRGMRRRQDAGAERCVACLVDPGICRQHGGWTLDLDSVMLQDASNTNKMVRFDSRDGSNPQRS